MIEIKESNSQVGPKILVIGVGGGGNNAVDRMIEDNMSGVCFAVVNTDLQVLESSKAETRIQIGKKITNGYGAGADPTIGEAAAKESEDEIENLVRENDLVIITSGMGGGTGTGATPVIARICRDLGILTIAVVTTPFSFECRPRANAAKIGVEKIKEEVDTLLVIPNDKLLTISEKPLEIEDAFVMADSVLKYTIAGITNIVYNKGMVNLDFNDIRATLKDKGMGHLGIGTVDADGSVVEAVKQAINSPLLDTSITGATNLLLNSSGKVDIVSLNEALEYVREITGDDVNLIWGNVKVADFDENKIVVTLIATGMQENKQASVKPDNTVAPIIPTIIMNQNTQGVSQGVARPKFQSTSRIITPTKKQVELEIPNFLKKNMH